MNNLVALQHLLTEMLSSLQFTRDLSFRVSLVTCFRMGHILIFSYVLAASKSSVIWVNNAKSHVYCSRA